MEKDIMIYTDGACSGNPGPGGWGAVLIYQGHEKELSGGEADTTNQRMELMAAIGALSALKKPEECKVTVYSDSAYLVNCFKSDWRDGWVKKGWKNSKGEPVANRDLWERLFDLVDQYKLGITFQKVKGHAGVDYNERCDALARAAVPAA